MLEKRVSTVWVLMRYARIKYPEPSLTKFNVNIYAICLDLLVTPTNKFLTACLAQDQLYTLAGVMAWDHGSVRGEARL